MARTAGRKQIPLPPPGTEPVSKSSEAITKYLFPGDDTRVVCRLCNQEFVDIESHLKNVHPGIPLEEYTAEFPDAPLKGKPPRKRKSFRISTEEIDAHPGGPDAAYNEKMLGPDERPFYRKDIENLLAQGYKPGYLLAQVAYYMSQSRRLRVKIQQVVDISKGQVVNIPDMKSLQEIDKLIMSNLADLEKARLAEMKTAEDPRRAVESWLDEIESYIVRHQGEFVEMCGHCHHPLTVPNIPHWAFEPLKTERGLEWPVWSGELWRLVKNGMPIWIMAYTLRTSPEGLKWTAQRRGEAWPESIHMDEQERILRRVLETHHIDGAPVDLQDIHKMFQEDRPTEEPEVAQEETVEVSEL